MKIKTKKAIEMAKENKSLSGILIEDLNEVQVNAKDALALAEHGIIVPEQNLYYDDKDIVYDPDFDETEWSKQPLQMSWKEKAELFKNAEQVINETDHAVTLNIVIKDKEAREWARKNYSKVAEMLGDIVERIYRTYKLIK